MKIESFEELYEIFKNSERSKVSLARELSRNYNNVITYHGSSLEHLELEDVKTLLNQRRSYEFCIVLFSDKQGSYSLFNYETLEVSQK
ncbi:hypothetical protein SAMN05216353_11753 [Halobacillus alkaliphilus]|uniref:Uncharacterized protein n=1 Tax=Halobacillus alkaliphilus TaxID=396056 RepID=A0A1I2NAZ8_9BACI|nr:hypothetical protein [Halobacillus alkaliphilus]SFF98907.1 hypothetical protein SAMN05216353_11753 [Halobacillus alkaliphilus]